MPPPDTETDKVTPSQPIQPPAPPPPPPPIPAPTAPTSTPEFANIAAVDTELERLRMTYIAGEITRETYYARRADLEAVRRSMATPAGPAGALGPKRLDLDMDNLPEPAQQQRPVLRRKPQDPGLSLELPLPGEDD